MTAVVHRCHAEGCELAIPPRLLFCLPHWRRVTAETKRAIWREYRESARWPHFRGPSRG